MMEECTQITLDQWTQWKEDIREKLSQTVGNFVHIGYRLKQIRDSGMFGGAEDVFEFAQREYGLGKSTVSRFIAINEKYSEGGNSLELKEEFRKFSSSKLSEMLTLPDSEIQLITERTTVKEIRELKEFNRQEPQKGEKIEGEGQQEAPQEPGLPLKKCLIDFFRTKRGLLGRVMACMDAEPREYREAAEMMNPSGQSSHKKGIVFLFMYDWNTGVKYKLLTQQEPVSLTWPELLDITAGIYEECGRPDVWEDFYREEEKEEKNNAEKDIETAENQGFKPVVATSQQPEKGEKNAESDEEFEGVEEGAGNSKVSGSESDNDVLHKLDEGSRETAGRPDTAGEGGAGETGAGKAESGAPGERRMDVCQKTGGDQEEQIPGQDNIMNHDEWIPEEMKAEKKAGEMPEPERAENHTVAEAAELAEEADRLIRELTLAWADLYLNEGLREEEMQKAEKNAEQLIADIKQLLSYAEDGWIEMEVKMD